MDLQAFLGRSPALDQPQDSSREVLPGRGAWTCLATPAAIQQPEKRGGDPNRDGRVSWAGSLQVALHTSPHHSSLDVPIWDSALGMGVKDLSSAKPPWFVILLFVLNTEFHQQGSPQDLTQCTTHGK